MPSRPYKDLVIYGCFVLNRLVAAVGIDLYQEGLETKLELVLPGQRGLSKEEVKREIRSNHFMTDRVIEALQREGHVTVEVAEIGLYLATTRRRFDAILLDVDNGPSALSRAGNEALYRRPGLAAFSGALRPRGALVVWSASEAPRFVAELSRAGFDAKEQRVTGRHGGGNVLILGRPRRVRSRR